MDHPSDRSEFELADLASGGLFTNPLQVIWRRKSFVFLGLVLGLVVGAIYYSRRAPVYQSTAQVMVIKKTPPALPGSTGSQYYEDYLPTHQILIKSPRIVDLAVKQRQLNALKSFEQEGSDPVNTIIGSLTVGTSAAFSNILNISMQGPEPDDCRAVLTAVIDSYQKFLNDTYKTVNDDTLAQVTQLTESLQKNLDKKEHAYAEFRQKNHTLWRGEGVSSVQEVVLTRIQDRQVELILQEADLRGKLQIIDKAIREKLDEPTLLAIIQRDSRKTGTETETNLRHLDERERANQMFALKVRERMLLEQFGTDHPEVVATRRQLEYMQDYRTRAEAEQKQLEAGKAKPRDQVQWYVSSLRQELTNVEENLKHLKSRLDAEENVFRDLGRFKAEDKRLRDDVARTQQLFEPIIRRLEEIKLVQDLGGYDAQVIAPPGTGWKVGPMALQIFFTAGILGLLGGFGLAFLAELSDKSFRTPEEIRRRLGLPIIGHIPPLMPLLEKETAGLDPTLCALHSPRSNRAEAFRGIRTALYFSTRGEVHKVIQVTSPESRDGKTTVAANLAISIAQSGKKVLLIDTDFRKPRLHRMFNVSAHKGLATVIADEAELKEAIIPTKVAGLSLLPCGPRPENPAELLTSPRFKELLDAMRDEFDFILLDTPPLLAVSDPSVVAPRVDAVLLILRISKNGKPAERAAEILKELGTQVLGIVVNGGDAAPGFGYHPYGRYGYAYIYGGYNHDRGYYSDEVPRRGKPTRTTRSAPDAEADPTEELAADQPAEPARGVLPALLRWWRS